MPSPRRKSKLPRKRGSSIRRSQRRSLQRRSLQRRSSQRRCSPRRSSYSRRRCSPQTTVKTVKTVKICTPINKFVPYQYSPVKTLSRSNVLSVPFGEGKPCYENPDKQSCEKQSKCAWNNETKRCLMNNESIAESRVKVTADNLKKAEEKLAAATKAQTEAKPEEKASADKAVSDAQAALDIAKKAKEIADKNLDNIKKLLKDEKKVA